MKRTILAAAVLLFVAPLIAGAQPQDDAWWGRVAEQNAINVASSEAHVQTLTLKNTIYLATFYRGRIDLSDSVAPIRALCDNGAEGDLRALALAALQTIATPSALAYLDRYATPAEAADARALITEVLNERHSTRLSLL